jgi:hypothetical protein
MGGSGGGNIGPAPAQAQPIDYNALMQSSAAAANSMVKQQYASMIENYPSLERLQLGSAQNIGTMLGAGGKLYSYKQVGKGKNATWEKVEVGEADPNLYTQRATDAVNAALTERDPMRAQADKLAGIGDWITARARESYEGSGPSSIESSLYNQGERELALGRSLSPEEIRDAQQAARSSMASRGLGQSLGTTAAEILNRDAYASAREQQRRAFAASANDMLTRNVMARRDQAAQQAALGSGVLGNAAAGYSNVANLGLQGAQANLMVDPVQRGIAPGLGLGANTLSTQQQMTTPIYQSAMGLAGDVSGFNANMMDSRYNSWANMRAANMMAGATRQAGMYGMIGGIGSGLLSGAGAAISDKREKKDIKPLGKAGKVLGLTAYEFKYKGEDQKHVGFMAQDVQKVLPEAVTEVDYKGKKRLAIKPAVIGAALAEELMTAKAA